MKLLLFIAGVPVLAFICYLLYWMRVGRVVADHLCRFETIYDQTFEETESKETALRLSLTTFKECPVLNRLTDDDYEQVICILKESPFPKKIINKIILKTDTRTSLKALRDPDHLNKMAAVGRAENNGEV